MRIQKIFTTILFSLFLSSVYAQTENCTLTIRGRVVDSDTQLPLAGVTIKAHPGGHQIISDGHGYFRFSQLCQDIHYVLTATSVGFDSLSIPLLLDTDETLTLALHHGHIVLHDVNVVGHQQTVSTANPVRTVSREQVAQVQGKTLADIFSTLPGVSMLQTGTTIAKPVINGMHGNRILILNNGVRQEGQQWGSEHAPEIDPFIAKDFKLIKGAEGVRYGADAIGGVIITSPPPLPIDPHLSGELNAIYQANGRGGVLSGMLQSGVKGITGLAWRVQGTAKRSGNVSTADYYLGNTGVAEYNASAAVRYSHTHSAFDAYYSRFHTSLGIFTGAHVGTIADIQARIEAGEPFETYPFAYGINAPRQRVTHDLGKLKWHRDQASGGSLDVQYGIQRNHRQEYDIRRAGRDALPMLDMVLTTQTLDATYQTPLYGKWRTQAGTNLTLQVNNNVPGTLNTPLIPNYDSFTAGAFAIQRLIENTHEWELGIRYDFRTFDAAGFDRYQNLYGGQRDFHNVSGSFGGVWRPGNTWQLRSNIGLAWRAPNANELYSNGLHHGAALYEIGDAQLNSEHGYKWVVSPSYTRGSVAIDLDLYGQYVQDYIYAQPSPGEFLQTIRGTFPVFRYEQTDATFFGADLSTKYQLSHDLEYQLSASIIRARDISNDVFLPYIPADRFNHRLRWQVPLTSKRTTETYITFEHRWVLQQKRYEPNTDYAPPPPAYHLFALYAGSKLAVGAHQLDVGVSVNNALNTPYREYMNRFRYYSHNLGREIGIRLSYSF
ncbi:TonB-dependent receptor [Parapedobacter koreensis]|uniref:Iron complex outermembrane recepter protein n=1 Tax=Parapedobacter koreensis TaxID=332977 RepID=A0A1H7M807_9SPHI|nr:TonB-dependent receptor [Parapedobacter koreensis]SEL07460.1 iron complex outermembrane recepter protein [Parapedobacter koreensis]